jgi:hypothetical protein
VFSVGIEQIDDFLCGWVDLSGAVDAVVDVNKGDVIAEHATYTSELAALVGAVGLLVGGP